MDQENPTAGTRQFPQWKNVLVEVEDRIAWVSLNRPDKRNCMSPALNDEMVEILDALEIDDSVGVIVLTGVGDSFSAGMDLKEFFRAQDHLPYAQQMRARRSAWQWQWRMLMNYSKPTIAMVNGWCFGGAFTPLVACDLAIADEDAQFGLSEINWGIIPGGNVTRAVVQTMCHRDAMYYVMTGETFDGRKAAEMKLVNEAVPKDRLRARTTELAKVLLGKNPTVLRAAKQAVRHVTGMEWELSDDYLMAKSAQARLLDPERGREQGMKQFLDEKTFKPGLAGYSREG
ncbi:p-hydroxycinnamoyl CoA hydratase/lyase [Roseomonas sp. BN140053]|uniref:p-hydroxycinnamoyl CoA hydratase/lyase n=1 Tax=Roseomonas sp. BN140053 TaxID=3391898 RepID=UPI0039EC2A9D